MLMKRVLINPFHQSCLTFSVPQSYADISRS